MNAELEIVRNPRSRRAKLSFDSVSGRVRLTLPPRAPLKAALRWAGGHQDWIDRQLSRLPVTRPFAAGALIPFDDAELTIVWAETSSRRVVRDGALLRCGGPADGVSQRIETWLRREALRILTNESREFAAKAGVTVATVSIGDAKGRWGSCSSTGAIRYNWRLILAPSFVRRSTVAHEIAHRIHMHHGPDFHSLASALTEGDPAESRAWLRAHGAGLHWFGRTS